MFVRIVLNNIYSFGKEKEFNMLPAPRFSKLSGHKYKSLEIELLKMASLYGANGSGKSNLIKAIDFLKDIVVYENLPSPIALKRLKHFHSTKEPTLLAIEFITDDVPFIYGVEIGASTILREELYISSLNEKESKLVFERIVDEKGKSTLKLFDGFTSIEEGKVLKNVIEQNLLKQNKTALKTLAELNNPLFIDIKRAFKWFYKDLVVLTPNFKVGALAHSFEKDSEYHKFAEELVCSFNVGIKELFLEKKPIEEFFGDDNKNDMEKLLQKLDRNSDEPKIFVSRDGSEINVIEEDGKVFVKQLKTKHTDSLGNLVLFDLIEESDGTVRLLDFVPVIRDLLSRDVTFFIDEIERSIHPLLIKEIIEKFSLDDSTRGQLIFTTHESNLLDLQLFRQDEIWFVEKDKEGSSDLYPLSDFKEHNTKDIRRGYLSGRYGSIPFLANLKDLKLSDV